MARKVRKVNSKQQQFAKPHTFGFVHDQDQFLSFSKALHPPNICSPIGQHSSIRSKLHGIYNAPKNSKSRLDTLSIRSKSVRPLPKVRLELEQFLHNIY